ncbi:MAG: type II toxin-antitoxin system HicA family toxin [Chloroflexi bacterium]|nr:type II toxin-antitoxin system HicA family toxin [Chloroflexota bacterium]
MTSWPSTKAPQVLRALLRAGWAIKRQSGSHRVLSKEGFHDQEEIGPAMLARIAKHTGLRRDQ